MMSCKRGILSIVIISALALAGDGPAFAGADISINDAERLVVGLKSAGCGPIMANGKRCPCGTELAGAAPPNGFEQWCQRMDVDENRIPIKEGVYVLWYENGHKREEGEYNNGNRDGRWTSWYENGQKEIECVVKNGELEGNSTMWYENGQKHAEGEWRNGGMNGFWTFWRENGQKGAVGELRNGVKEGSWTLWDESGRATVLEYKNGELVN